MDLRFMNIRYGFNVEKRKKNMRREHTSRTKSDKCIINSHR